MNRNAKHLWKALTVAAFMGVACSAGAQTQTVIASAGTTSGDCVFTLGEAFISDVSGYWATAVSVPSGIAGVYADGEVTIVNNADGTLDLNVPDALIAENAYYCLYALDGRMLVKEGVTTNPTRVDYGTVANGSVVVLTVNSDKSGRVASFKIVR